MPAQTNLETNSRSISSADNFSKLKIYETQHKPEFITNTQYEYLRSKQIIFTLNLAKMLILPSRF